MLSEKTNREIKNQIAVFKKETSKLRTALFFLYPGKHYKLWIVQSIIIFGIIALFSLLLNNYRPVKHLAFILCVASGVFMVEIQIYWLTKLVV